MRTASHPRRAPRITRGCWPLAAHAGHCVILLLVLAGGPARAEPDRPVPALGADGARLRFHLGGVRDNQPELSPTLPDLPGPTSAWYVAQWGKRDLLRPERMVRGDIRATDSALGAPLASFPTGSDESRLDVYRGVGGSSVFRLTAAAGERTGAGGANLFLAARARDGVTLAEATTYRVGLKLTQARVAAADPRSLEDGTVLAQVFTGFVLRFVDPATGRVTPAFLQIHHADSRGQPPSYRQCTVRAGVDELLAGGLVSDRFLPFAAMPHAAPAVLTYDLGRHVRALANATFDCRGADAAHTLHLPSAARDLRNWRLESVYLGLETQAADARHGAGAALAGSVRVGLQIASAEILAHRGTPPQGPAPAP